MPQQFKDEVLYDVRLIERHMRAGLLTRAAVDKRREASADMTEHCDKLDMAHLSRNAPGRKPQS